VLGVVLCAAPVFAQEPDVPEPKKPRAFELRAYVAAATEQTEAPRTFDAILGTERLTLLGGGAEIVIARRWLLRGQIMQFADTGTRVFVDIDRTVYPLDIPLKITVRPADLSAGYRFLVKPRWAAYAAGGWSRYEVTEQSLGESERTTGTGWHALGGLEAKPRRWLLLAGEAQWTKTEDMLAGGTAEALGEPRLGGVRLGLRAGVAF
jgi:hypothetical protein